MNNACLRLNLNDQALFIFIDLLLFQIKQRPNYADF